MITLQFIEEKLFIRRRKGRGKRRVIWLRAVLLWYRQLRKL